RGDWHGAEHADRAAYAVAFTRCRRRRFRGDEREPLYRRSREIDEEAVAGDELGDRRVNPIEPRAAQRRLQDVLLGGEGEQPVAVKVVERTAVGREDQLIELGR